MPRQYPPAWDRIRLRILARDGHRCQIKLDGCLGDANAVDHIIPTEAGGALLDPDNLRAACTPCNSTRASKTKAHAGWSRAATHITLVVGPPGAGKTTYVDQHRGPDDLVIDYDRMAQALGSPTTHGHDAHHRATMAARNAVLRQIRRGETGAPAVWIISSNPHAGGMFPHHEIVTIDPGEDEVRRRAEQAGRPDEWGGLIGRWYEAQATGNGSRQWL